MISPPFSKHLPATATQLRMDHAAAGFKGYNLMLEPVTSVEFCGYGCLKMSYTPVMAILMWNYGKMLVINLRIWKYLILDPYSHTNFCRHSSSSLWCHKYSLSAFKWLHVLAASITLRVWAWFWYSSSFPELGVACAVASFLDGFVLTYVCLYIHM